MFIFFLKSYRCKILDFCGVEVDVLFDVESEDGKYSFREFENGILKKHDLRSRHSNILKGVIIGKKSWGLHLKMWSEGINEWCFTKDEILQIFKDNNIDIPKSLMIEFDNLISKKRIERIENYLNNL
jgi:hypothetical protein